MLTERDPARPECELLDRMTGPLQNGCPGLDLLPSSPEEAEEELLRESPPQPYLRQGSIHGGSADEQREAHAGDKVRNPVRSGILELIS